MEMVSMSSCLLSIDGNFLLSSQYPSRPPTLVKWGYRKDQDGSSVTKRIKMQTFRILANPNVSGNSNPLKEIIMVDPLEAKQLAAKQMKEIQKKERLMKRRQIEAINGAWAMIGLTAGLVIEGHTGKSILEQLAGYWSAIAHFFGR
ncbi:cytochrome P450 [Salix suchowensis]|nr:cytochrome P450 [Salix suchowensis]